MTCQDYLLAQYPDASNLNARTQLHQRYSTHLHDWQEWVYDQLDLPLSLRILELGCGPGYLRQRNLARIPKGCKITLSDFSPGMSAEARQNLSCQDLAYSRCSFCFVVHDAQAVPFSDATFDTVLANHMFYHVPDRAQAFSEIRRVLDPGGRFYAATNDQAHMRELQELHERSEADAGRRIGAVTAPFTLENGFRTVHSGLGLMDG
jgi:ubiquinone/menaquinone biosynthesis C-methylase UbiE